MRKPTDGPANKNRHGPLPHKSLNIPPRLTTLLLAAFGSALLGGCNLELLTPKGSVGEQEKSLILISLFVMLMVVIPVIVLTLWFAWRYRETNTSATYAP